LKEYYPNRRQRMQQDMDLSSKSFADELCSTDVFLLLTRFP